MTDRVVICSLDLSLRGAGMVALPLDWGGDWSRVARHTYGESLPRDAPEARRIGRLTRIAVEILAFVARNDCTDVVIEQYAFNQNAAGARAVGEIGGVVKHQLVEKLGLIPATFVASAARKFVLGLYPRSEVKQAVRCTLKKMGMPDEWTMDEADAFVGANYTAAGLGGYAIATPPPPPRKTNPRDPSKMRPIPNPNWRAAWRL